MRKYLSRLAIALSIAATPIGAIAADFTVAVGTPVTSMDPLFHDAAANGAIAVNIFDALIDRDEANRLRPGLATSWTSIDDTTWEFKLRQDVKFHDGTPFVAEDVVATIKRVPNVQNSPGSYAHAVSEISEVIVVDPETIHIKTFAPAPLLPLKLTLIAILSHKYIDAPTADYNRGIATIGTGPFKFERYVPEDRIVLSANPDYWGGKPQWDRVTFRTITNDAARVAALRSGDVDLIDKVPTDMVESLDAAGLKVASAPTPALIWLALDQFRDQSPYVSAKDGSPLAENPLKDVRVREAISLAVNREQIVSEVFAGQAVASNDLVPPTSPAAIGAALEPTDLEKAKALLAEAGYPDGFNVTLHAPPDRYYGAERVILAIASMLTQIGINAQVEMVLWANYLPAMNESKYSIQMNSRGLSGDPTEVLRNGVASKVDDRTTGASNPGRYSNAEVDALTHEILATLDDDRRHGLIRKASEITWKEKGIIPLYFFNNIWASRADLEYEAYANNYIRPLLIRKAQ